jgi:hypothetical protein
LAWLFQGLFLYDDEPVPVDNECIDVPVSHAGSATVDARSILSSCSGDVSLGLEDHSVRFTKKKKRR